MTDSINEMVDYYTECTSCFKKCFKLAILSLIHGRHSCADLFRQSLAIESDNRSEEKDQVAESVS